MFKSALCAAAILFAAMSSASAQLVLFSGAGYVSAASANCSSEGIYVNTFLVGAYLPANLGSNGTTAQFTHSSLPQNTKPHAVGIVASGPLTTTYQTANGTKITPLEVQRFKPQIKLRSKPATISAATKSASLAVTIRRGNGINGCTFTVNLNVGRRN